MREPAGDDRSSDDTKRVSRREFAKTSVAAGTAALALPGKLLASDLAARAEGRPLRSAESSGEGSWAHGMAIPAEYYLDDDHYLNDERYIAVNYWQFVDQASRIRNPGDFFVFEFGRSESILIVRGQDGEVRGFHNVCRHRGSRLCRHDADEVPGDPRLSVKQLGQSGSSPVFRCPYHAWTYDTEGSLIYAYGMQDDFDPTDNGLIPCHLQVVEGQIFVSLADDPPELEPRVTWFRQTNDIYNLPDLKVAARELIPVKANWKLVIENWAECYHCGPAHTSLVTTHYYNEEMSNEQHVQQAARVKEWVGDKGKFHSREDEDFPEHINGTGYLNPGYLTGSLDGKPVAPLLPGIEEWNHNNDGTDTYWSSGYWQTYNDHVLVIRFTPRDIELTDCEFVWLVHPDAVEGRDYDPDNVKALWYVTFLEDLWIVENNHIGIKSAAYRPGRYSIYEDGGGGAAGFVKWYMDEVVPPDMRPDLA
jgi:Rieske 2Fe-2S family protein